MLARGNRAMPALEGKTCPVGLQWNVGGEEDDRVCFTSPKLGLFPRAKWNSAHSFDQMSNTVLLGI